MKMASGQKLNLKDVNRFNGDNIELDVTIVKEDLKALAQYLADEYLKEIKSFY